MERTEAASNFQPRNSAWPGRFFIASCTSASACAAAVAVVLMMMPSRPALCWPLCALPATLRPSATSDLGSSSKRLGWLDGVRVCCSRARDKQRIFIFFSYFSYFFFFLPSIDRFVPPTTSSVLHLFRGTEDEREGTEQGRRGPRRAEKETDDCRNRSVHFHWPESAVGGCSDDDDDDDDDDELTDVQVVVVVRRARQPLADRWR